MAYARNFAVSGIDREIEWNSNTKDQCENNDGYLLEKEKKEKKRRMFRKIIRYVICICSAV